MSNVDFDIDDVWPHNFSIGEAQCALGVSLINRLDKINNRRVKYFIFTTNFQIIKHLVY